MSSATYLTVCLSWFYMAFIAALLGNITLLGLQRLGSPLPISSRPHLLTMFRPVGPARHGFRAGEVGALTRVSDCQKITRSGQGGSVGESKAPYNRVARGPLHPLLSKANRLALPMITTDILCTVPSRCINCSTASLRGTLADKRSPLQ